MPPQSHKWATPPSPNMSSETTSVMDVSQLVHLGSLVRVDIFDVVVVLVASVDWLFDDVLDGPVQPFFLPQIPIPNFI
jgi:hypothetical protein